MIQQLKLNFKNVWRNSNKWIYFTVISIVIIEAVLMYFYPIDAEKTETLLGNILSFSSIVVAILVTFIFSKIFQIRNEKIEVLKDLKSIGHKVTHFRRICRIVRDSHQIWNENIKSKMRREFPEVDFFIAHDLNLEKDSDEYKLRQSYWDSSLYHSLSDFYLSLESFCLDHYNYNHELWDDYNHDLVYNINIIEKWLESGAANQIWYYFDYKFRRISSDLDITQLYDHEKEQILELARKINSEKYNKRKLDRYLFSDLGTDFHSYHLPKLYRKSVVYFEEIPSSLKFLINLNFVLIIIGVLLPIVLLAINIDSTIKRIVCDVAILIFSGGLIIFLYQFTKLLKSEISFEQ